VAAFNNQYSLQPFVTSGTGPRFTVLDQNGNPIPNQTTSPAAGEPQNAALDDWALEMSIDVEWAHVVAPQANIILFEANSAGWGDLATAVQTAAGYNGVSVVSMSWGGSNFSGTQYDPYFTTPSGHANDIFVAATGDYGSPGNYPAFSPNVVAVGGEDTMTVQGRAYALAC
jgi:subtilase family serine protease